jgi:hypothetical protein
MQLHWQISDNVVRRNINKPKKKRNPGGLR